MSTEAVPAGAASAGGPPAERARVIGLRDATLFTVSAIVVVDTLTASAAIGARRSAGGCWRSGCF